MFERYTESARRSLFFARYEASQFGSASIETEHMLLGLLREGGLTPVLASVPVERIRREVESRVAVREKIPTSMEIPFSEGTKRALGFGAEEADRLLHAHIGSEHLLLGLLRHEDSVVASALAGVGLRLSDVRADVEKLRVPLQAAPYATIKIEADHIKSLVEQLAQIASGDARAGALAAGIKSRLNALLGMDEIR